MAPRDPGTRYLLARRAHNKSCNTLQKAQSQIDRRLAQLLVAMKSKEAALRLYTKTAKRLQVFGS